VSATVTTIVPTFQRPQRLARAIESVLRQTHADLVVQVYDNASQDETPDVVARLSERDARVRYVRRPSNLGAAANFARGMADIATPFFSFLSDDDVLLPEFFATALAALEKEPAALMFAGSTLEFDERGTLRYVPLAYWPREGRYDPPESMLRMLDNRHPTWTGAMFRRDAIERIGVLDEDVPAAMDFDYEIRVASRAPIVVSFKPCAAWIVHPGTVSANQGVDVVDSLSRVAAKLAGDESIEPRARAEVVQRLRRQIRGKLLEISVKAQVRGDSATSGQAAQALGDRFGARWLAASLRAMSWSCTRVPPLQSLLAWMETERLRARAAASRRRAAASVPDLARYAEYLKISPTL
jgi:glycosyltransferase involved in cell wall biosynthesis